MADKITIQKWREERADLYKRAKALQLDDKGEFRNLDAEQNAQFDAMMGDYDALGSKIERAEKLLKAEAELAAPAGSPEQRAHRNQPVTLGNDGCTPTGGQFAEREERALSNARKTALRAYLQNGERGLAGLGEAERRAMTISDTGNGGYLLPQQEFVADLIKDITVLAPIRSVARLLSTSNAISVGLPTVKITRPSAAVAEVGDAPALGVQTGQRSLTPHRMAIEVEVSRQMLHQGGSFVETVVREALAEGLGAEQEDWFLLGDGVNKALGLFVASAMGIPTSRDFAGTNTQTELKIDTFIDAKGELKGPYQNSPTTRWIMHRKIATALRKLKATADGQYLWQPSLVVGTPDVFLGVPVMLSESAPYAMTASQYVATIGDMKHYAIQESLAITVQKLDQAKASQGLTVFLVEAYLDAMPTKAEAFARVKMGA